MSFANNQLMPEDKGKENEEPEVHLSWLKGVKKVWSKISKRTSLTKAKKADDNAPTGTKPYSSDDFGPVERVKDSDYYESNRKDRLQRNLIDGWQPRRRGR